MRALAAVVIVAGLLAVTGCWANPGRPATLPATGPGAAAGFFRTRQVDGRWWLVDPRGELFLSKGVTTVSYAQDHIRGTNVSPYAQANEAKYGSIDAWRAAAARRLMGWGFNSLGAWSDEALCAIEHGGRRLVCAPNLDLGAKYVERKMNGRGAWLEGIFPDVFDPDFETIAREVSRERCAARKDDPSIMGWFTDNELRWGPDWRGKDEVLTMFLSLPKGSPGRKAAVAMLQQRYGEFGKFNAVWKTECADWGQLADGGPVKPPFVRAAVYSQNQGIERARNEANPDRRAFVGDCDEFIGLLAERYFRITAEAIRSADPNHMIFGARFAYVPPSPVVAAAAKYVDAVSFNCYKPDPRPMIRAYAAFGKPLIIGEFAFRAKDSGLPNTKGAGPVVAAQKDRADGFARFVALALSEPNIVGYHWFEHCDEPKEGRFDGEDSNYGVVNIKDEPYTVVVEEMTRINAKAEEFHRGR